MKHSFYLEKDYTEDNDTKEKYLKSRAIKNLLKDGMIEEVEIGYEITPQGLEFYTSQADGPPEIICATDLLTLIDHRDRDKNDRTPYVESEIIRDLSHTLSHFCPDLKRNRYEFAIKDALELLIQENLLSPVLIENERAYEINFPKISKYIRAYNLGYSFNYITSVEPGQSGYVVQDGDSISLSIQGDHNQLQSMVRSPNSTQSQNSKWSYSDGIKVDDFKNAISHLGKEISKAHQEDHEYKMFMHDLLQSMINWNVENKNLLEIIKTNKLEVEETNEISKDESSGFMDWFKEYCKPEQITHKACWKLIEMTIISYFLAS